MDVEKYDPCVDNDSSDGTANFFLLSKTNLSLQRGPKKKGGQKLQQGDKYLFTFPTFYPLPFLPQSQKPLEEGREEESQTPNESRQKGKGGRKEK